MRSWAQHVAINMPSQYLCNVSGLPERDAAWNHPGLQGENLKDFLLPPRTHLFLYGPSHVRSVRHVLVSAARLQNRSVKSDNLSVSDDCDETREATHIRRGTRTRIASKSAAANTRLGAGAHHCGTAPSPCSLAPLSTSCPPEVLPRVALF